MSVSSPQSTLRQGTSEREPSLSSPPRALTICQSVLAYHCRIASRRPAREETHAFGNPPLVQLKLVISKF